MEFLVSSEEIRGTESGSITIPESKFAHSDIPEVDKVLTEEYAKLVEENPEYEFAIVRDFEKIWVGWRLRT